MELQKPNLMILPFLMMMYMPQANAQTSDDAKKLLDTLFSASGYNTAVRPTYEQTKPTNVSIDFFLVSIINFDSQKETLTTSGYLYISWTDYYLQWTPETYGNLTYIFIPQDNVWKPDISLLNGISEVKGLGSNSLFVRVDNAGTVYWLPFGIFESTCGIDITYFPFDIQTCDLTFNAWSYFNEHVNVTKGMMRNISLEMYKENSEWSIVDTSVDRLQGEVQIVFSIKLKRKPLFFVLNVIVPVMLLSILNICIFIIPAKSGEKASFSVTVFLALAVFLTMVTTLLPQNSENVSFIGIYLVITVVFSTVIVTLTLFILRLNFRDVDEDPIPSWLIKLHGIVIKIRCRRHTKVHPATQSQDEVSNFDTGYTVSSAEATSGFTESNSPSQDEKSKITWNHICNALDFIFFWIFLLATGITIVTVFSICIENAVQ
ncbi:hypothetical protein ACJMK2_028121 [Sinanodonta woodiana]|uniref:Uncharacterized protein n=1 Tax=Sinanodonta woodiana TaxID=1069815 RepID=A0ABD3X651_SINWO